MRRRNRTENIPFRRRLEFLLLSSQTARINENSMDGKESSREGLAATRALILTLHSSLLPPSLLSDIACFHFYFHSLSNHHRSA